MKVINVDELRAAMYHEAFEEDSDLQKWDGGCWIRYKMFENVLDSILTIDIPDTDAEVVRCEDCRHLSNYRIAPDWNRLCRRLGIGKAENGFCDEAERREV